MQHDTTTLQHYPLKKSKWSGMNAKSACAITNGTSFKAKVEVVKPSRRRCIRRTRKPSRPKLQHHHRHQPPAPLPGTTSGGLNLGRHHHGRETNGGRTGGEYLHTAMRARGDPARRHKAGGDPMQLARKNRRRVTFAVGLIALRDSSCADFFKVFPFHRKGTA